MNVFSLKDYKQAKAEQYVMDGGSTISLPVAPLATFRTKFASMQQGQPHCMLPGEVLHYLAEAEGVTPEKKITVVIAGPGDPLATPDEILKVMRTIKDNYPEAGIEIRTLGIGGAELAAAYAEAGVTRIELITDGFTPETIAGMYLWIRPGRKTLALKKATAILFEEQRQCIEAFRECNVPVYGNISCHAGTTTQEVKHTCSVLKELKVAGVSLSVVSSDAEGESAPDIDSLRAAAAEYLPLTIPLPAWQAEQAADAAGLSGKGLPKPSAARPNVAVVSSNGMEVDMHLGHADRVLVYGPRDDGLACLLDTRTAPPKGGGNGRWQELASMLSDCFALLVASAGASPRKILGANGIRVMVVNDPIEGCVDVLYGGGKKNKCKQ